MHRSPTKNAATSSASAGPTPGPAASHAIDRGASALYNERAVLAQQRCGRPHRRSRIHPLALRTLLETPSRLPSMKDVNQDRSREREGVLLDIHRRLFVVIAATRFLIAVVRRARLTRLVLRLLVLTTMVSRGPMPVLTAVDQVPRSTLIPVGLLVAPHPALADYGVEVTAAEWQPRCQQQRHAGAKWSTAHHAVRNSFSILRRNGTQRSHRVNPLHQDRRFLGGYLKPYRSR